MSSIYDDEGRKKILEGDAVENVVLAAMNKVYPSAHRTGSHSFWDIEGDEFDYKVEVKGDIKSQDSGNLAFELFQYWDDCRARFSGLTKTVLTEPAYEVDIVEVRLFVHKDMPFWMAYRTQDMLVWLAQNAHEITRIVNTKDSANYTVRGQSNRNVLVPAVTFLRDDSFLIRQTMSDLLPLVDNHFSKLPRSTATPEQTIWVLDKILKLGEHDGAGLPPRLSFNMENYFEYGESRMPA